MLKKKDLVRTPEYWMETIQNELFRQLSGYMDKEKINQTELAGKLNVSKGYISQVLNGAFNFTLRKLIELALSIGKVPYVSFITPEEYLIKEGQKKEDEEAKSREAKVVVQDIYLREHYAEIEKTLKRIEELKEYNELAYSYFRENYKARLRMLLKSIDIENNRVECFLNEIKSPDVYSFQIDNKPANAAKVLRLVGKHAEELKITDVKTGAIVPNGSTWAYMVESLKNNGENVESKIAFEKLNFEQN